MKITSQEELHNVMRSYIPIECDLRKDELKGKTLDECALGDEAPAKLTKGGVWVITGKPFLSRGKFNDKMAALDDDNLLQYMNRIYHIDGAIKSGSLPAAVITNGLTTYKDENIETQHCGLFSLSSFFDSMNIPVYGTILGGRKVRKMHSKGLLEPKVLYDLNTV